MARSNYEILAQKELEKQGYKVDFKVRPSRPMRGYNTDFFGLFDLIAVRAGDPVRWLSIKGHANIPAKHKEAIEKFFLPLGNQKEIWVYRADGSIRKVIIEDPSPEGVN